MALDDSAFWEEQHSRDLLYLLRARWPEFSGTERAMIVQRLLQGRRTRYQFEEEDEYVQRRAFASLSRLYWLQGEGCELGIDLDEATKELRAEAPNWKPEYAPHAADGLESRAGVVRTDTAYSELENEDPAGLVEKAFGLSGRTDDFLVERDPFLGLSREQPDRALRALRTSVATDDALVSAWKTFLRHDVRSEHDVTVLEGAARQLLNLGSDLFSQLTRSVADWLEFASSRAKDREPIDRDLFLALFDRCATSLAENPLPSGLLRSSRNTPDWIMEAINAPAGSLADALFNDPELPLPSNGSGLPHEWSGRAAKLLTLPGDQQHYTRVLLSRRVHYLFAQDEDWTERTILADLDAEDRSEIILQGILSSNHVPREKLFRRIKNHLIERAYHARDERDRYDEALAAFLLAGWAFDGPIPLISDEEFRSIILRSHENFRSRILWQAWSWAKPKTQSDGDKAGISDLWGERLLRLFREVWPKQRAAQSGRTASRMIDIVFESGSAFPELAEAIKPFLVPDEDHYLLLPELRREKNSVVERYPEITLDLLSRVLPNDKRKWPYGLEGTLSRIAKVAPELADDNRFITIKRRLDR